MVAISAARGTVCDFDLVFCIVFNCQEVISQVDNLSFCRKTALFCSHHEIASNSHNSVVKAAVVVMSTVQSFALMLSPTLSCIQLLPEKLGVEYDFRLDNFEFFKCKVALSYLIESIESVFCHCTTVKLGQFMILGNLVYVCN